MDYKNLHTALRSYKLALKSGDDAMIAFQRSEYEAECKKFGENPDEYFEQDKAIARALTKGY